MGLYLPSVRDVDDGKVDDYDDGNLISVASFSKKYVLHQVNLFRFVSPFLKLVNQMRRL